MEQNYSLRTHIIPIGNDKLERIIKPLKKLRADRVYLLTVKDKDAFAKEFKEMQDILRDQFNLSPDNIITAKIDYYNTTEFLSKIAEIYKKEDDEGNDIFMDIVGGTMISVVGTIASFYFGVKTYFLKFDYINNEFDEEPTFPDIPRYSIGLPEEKHVTFLISILKYLQLKKSEEITKGECIDVINVIFPSEDITGKEPKDYNKLNTRFLSKLEENKMIYFKDKRERQISITEFGNFTANVFSNFYSINEKDIHKKIKKM